MGILATSGFGQNGPITYPKAPKSDVTYDYFEVKVADPYRWLEATDNSAETADWVKAEIKLPKLIFRKFLSGML